MVWPQKTGVNHPKQVSLALQVFLLYIKTFFVYFVDVFLTYFLCIFYFIYVFFFLFIHLFIFYVLFFHFCFCFPKTYLSKRCVLFFFTHIFFLYIHMLSCFLWLFVHFVYIHIWNMFLFLLYIYNLLRYVTWLVSPQLAADEAAATSPRLPPTFLRTWLVRSLSCNPSSATYESCWLMMVEMMVIWWFNGG